MKFDLIVPDEWDWAIPNWPSQTYPTKRIAAELRALGEWYTVRATPDAVIIKRREDTP